METTYLEQLKPVYECYSTLEGVNNNGQIIVTLYKTGSFYSNGDNYPLQFIQFSKPSYIKCWDKEGLTNQTINKEIELNDWSRWNKELKEGQKVEISEAIYDDLLGCLPPHKMELNYFEVGEPHHHNKGRAIHRACWIENERFYTGYPKNQFNN